MDWKPGLILRIKDYKFEDDGTARDKYSIVLYTKDEEAYLIHSLTTTQNNLSVTALKYGCSIHKGNLPYYYFPKDQIIGNENFSFEKDTFIFFQANVRKEPFAKFETAAKKSVFGLITLGLLTNEELKRILKCALKSKFIPLEIEKELAAFKETL
ncbi:MAG TPA: hypothetical protein VMY77_18020 [Chitinophagaceae bacterium]|nr:hypothetical protein [Chitinophagaceae bacterium]